MGREGVVLRGLGERVEERGRLLKPALWCLLKSQSAEVKQLAIAAYVPDATADEWAPPLPRSHTRLRPFTGANDHPITHHSHPSPSTHRSPSPSGSLTWPTTSRPTSRYSPPRLIPQRAAWWPARSSRETQTQTSSRSRTRTPPWHPRSRSSAPRCVGNGALLTP